MSDMYIFWTINTLGYKYNLNLSIFAYPNIINLKYT